jgi:hypothetical protein
VLGVCLLASPPSALAGNDPLIDEIAPFKLALLQKFDAKQFAELEQLEQELRSAKARVAGGDWKLFHFYRGLSAAHVIEDAPLESDWLAVIAALKEWQAHSPGSAVPLLLLADTYTSFAWYARGTGRSETVTPRRWDLFKDRLNQGAFHLNASRRLSSANPQWYVTALRIAQGLQWPRDRAESLLEEVAALEPLYQHAYSGMATFLLPRWYGEPGDWEKFAQDTADRIGGLEGSAVYNHIALQVSGPHGAKEFFEENDVNWRKLQWSFADREKLYGVGVQSLNRMCWLAGGIDDKPAARAFMKRIGDDWDQSVWRTRQVFDRFKQWLEAE